MSDVHFEVLDHNIAAGYVTLILDLWFGDRHDPAVAVTRYIGVWDETQLENGDGEAKDPDFSKMDRHRSYYHERRIQPSPKVWQEVDTVKAADEEAERFRKQSNQLTEKEAYRYGSERTKADLYQKFLEAIEVLVEDEENKEAWEAVDAWRNHHAMMYEK